MSASAAARRASHISVQHSRCKVNTRVREKILQQLIGSDLTSKAGIGYDLVKFSSVTSMTPHLQFLENYMGF
jgi:hypothetical protein